MSRSSISVIQSASAASDVRFCSFFLKEIYSPQFPRIAGRLKRAFLRANRTDGAFIFICDRE